MMEIYVQQILVIKVNVFIHLIQILVMISEIVQLMIDVSMELVLEIIFVMIIMFVPLILVLKVDVHLFLLQILVMMKILAQLEMYVQMESVLEHHYPVHANFQENVMMEILAQVTNVLIINVLTNQ